MSDSGSIRKLTLDGITYDVHGDSNVTSQPNTENENLPTSGTSVQKTMLKSPDKEGIVVGADVLANKELEALAKRRGYTMAIEYADGSVERATGRIAHEGWESEENRATIKLLPENANVGWVAFKG